MKRSIITSLVLIVFTLVSYGQVMTVCTPEQLKAAENRRLASTITVINTATQQQQCYYSQLATYWQQVDKDNQQKAKDAQQIAKDAQQVAQDRALAEKEAALAAREAACQTVQPVPEPEVHPWLPDGCGGFKKTVRGELWTHSSAGTFIDGIPLEAALRMKGEAACMADDDYVAYKKEWKAQHTNHSGGGDGTNPGGHGNTNGFLNPNNAK